MAISVGVPNSILRQSAMAQSGYPNPSFPPKYTIVCATPAMRTRRDPGGKPSGVRAYYPPLRFPQSTLDDSGHNRYGPTPMLQAMRLQSYPPRDTNNCHALKMMHVWWQPHAVIPSVTPNIMQLGTS